MAIEEIDKEENLKRVFEVAHRKMLQEKGERIGDGRIGDFQK